LPSGPAKPARGRCARRPLRTKGRKPPRQLAASPSSAPRSRTSVRAAGIRSPPMTAMCTASRR
jgi:hypothetical protein